MNIKFYWLNQNLKALTTLQINNKHLYFYATKINVN
jgi:hypothetical protein